MTAFSAPDIRATCSFAQGSNVNDHKVTDDSPWSESGIDCTDSLRFTVDPADSAKKYPSVPDREFIDWESANTLTAHGPNNDVTHTIPAPTTNTVIELCIVRLPGIDQFEVRDIACASYNEGSGGKMGITITLSSDKKYITDILYHSIRSISGSFDFDFTIGTEQAEGNMENDCRPCPDGVCGDTGDINDGWFTQVVAGEQCHWVFQEALSGNLVECKTEKGVWDIAARTYGLNKFSSSTDWKSSYPLNCVILSGSPPSKRINANWNRKAADDELILQDGRGTYGGDPVVATCGPDGENEVPYNEPEPVVNGQSAYFWVYQSGAESHSEGELSEAFCGDEADNDCDTAPDDGCSTGSSSFACRSSANVMASWGTEDPETVPDDVYKSSNTGDKCCGDDTGSDGEFKGHEDGTISIDVPTVESNYLCAATIFSTAVPRAAAQFQWFQDSTDKYGCVWQTDASKVALGGRPYIINAPEANPRFVECSSGTAGRVVGYGKQHQFLCMKGKTGKYANQYFWAECAGDDYYGSGAISDIPDSCPQVDFNAARMVVNKAKPNDDFLFGTGESVPEYGLGCSDDGVWIDLSQADEAFCTALPNQGVWVGGRCCGGGALEIGLATNKKNHPYSGAYYSALSSSQDKTICFQNVGIPSASTLGDKSDWVVNEEWYLQNKKSEIKSNYNPYHLSQLGARVLNADGNLMSCKLNSVKSITPLTGYLIHNYQELPLTFPQASELPGACGVNYLPCPDINGDDTITATDQGAWDADQLNLLDGKSSKEICNAAVDPDDPIKTLCDKCKIFLEDGSPDIVACLDFNCDGQFVGSGDVSSSDKDAAVPPRYPISTQCIFGKLYGVTASGVIDGTEDVTPDPPEPLVVGKSGYLLHPVENCAVQTALSGDASGSGTDYLCSYKEEGFLKDPYFTLTEQGKKEGFVSNGETIFSAIKKAGGNPESNFKQAATDFGYTGPVVDRSSEVLEFDDEDYYYADDTWSALWHTQSSSLESTGDDWCASRIDSGSTCLGIYQPVIYFDMTKNADGTTFSTSIPLSDMNGEDIASYTISEEHYYSAALCDIPLQKVYGYTKNILPTFDTSLWKEYPFRYGNTIQDNLNPGVFDSTNRVSTYAAPFKILCSALDSPSFPQGSSRKLRHGNVPALDSLKNPVPAACCPGSDYCWRDPTIGSVGNQGTPANPASRYSDNHNGISVWWVNPGCVENMIDEPLTPPQLGISYEKDYSAADTQLFEAEGELVFDPIISGERCINSKWELATKKQSWDNKYAGYCPEEDMCLVNPYADFSTKLVQRPTKNVDCPLKCLDLNGDGKVDDGDKNVLIGINGYDAAYDLDCNGEVDHDLQDGGDGAVIEQFKDVPPNENYIKKDMDGRPQGKLATALCMPGEIIPGYYVTAYSTTETASVPFNFDDTQNTPINIVRQYPKIWKMTSDESRFYSDARFREDPDSYNIQCVPKNSYLGDHYCLQVNSTTRSVYQDTTESTVDLGTIGYGDTLSMPANKCDTCTHLERDCDGNWQSFGDSGLCSATSLTWAELGYSPPNQGGGSGGDALQQPDVTYNPAPGCSLCPDVIIDDNMRIDSLDLDAFNTFKTAKNCFDAKRPVSGKPDAVCDPGEPSGVLDPSDGYITSDNIDGGPSEWYSVDAQGVKTLLNPLENNGANAYSQYDFYGSDTSPKDADGILNQQDIQKCIQPNLNKLVIQACIVTPSGGYWKCPDYDLNGEVGVSDITPLGIHYGHPVPDTRESPPVTLWYIEFIDPKQGQGPDVEGLSAQRVVRLNADLITETGFVRINSETDFPETFNAVFTDLNTNAKTYVPVERITVADFDTPLDDNKVYYMIHLLTFGSTSLVSWFVDGDGNGEVNIADITPIGMRFQAYCDAGEFVNAQNDVKPLDLSVFGMKMFWQQWQEEQQSQVSCDIQAVCSATNFQNNISMVTTAWITRTQIASLLLEEYAEPRIKAGTSSSPDSYSLYCDRYDKVLDDYGYYVFNTDPNLINKNPGSNTASNTLKQYLEGTGFCSQQEGSLDDNACSNNLCVLAEYKEGKVINVAIAGALNRDIMESVKGPLSTRSFYDTVRYPGIFVKAADSQALPEDLGWCTTKTTKGVVASTDIRYQACDMKMEYATSAQKPRLEWYGKYTDTDGVQHDNYNIFILYSDYTVPSSSTISVLFQKFINFLSNPITVIHAIIQNIADDDIKEYNIFQGLTTASGTRSDLTDWFQRIRIGKDFPQENQDFNKFFFIKKKVGGGSTPVYKQVFGVIEQAYFKPELSQLDTQKSLRGYLAVGYTNFDDIEAITLQSKISRYKQQISFRESSEQTGAGDMVMYSNFANYTSDQTSNYNTLIGYINWEFVPKSGMSKDFTQPGDNMDFTFIPPLARVFEDFAPETRIKTTEFSPNSVCQYSMHTVYGEGCPAGEYPVLVLSGDTDAYAAVPGNEGTLPDDGRVYVCSKLPTKANACPGQGITTPSFWIDSNGLGHLTKTECEEAGSPCTSSCFDIGKTYSGQIDPASFSCMYMDEEDYTPSSESFCVLTARQQGGRSSSGLKFQSCDYPADNIYTTYYVCTCDFSFINVTHSIDIGGDPVINITTDPGSDPPIITIITDPDDDTKIIVIITDPTTGDTTTIPDVSDDTTIIINGEEHGLVEFMNRAEELPNNP